MMDTEKDLAEYMQKFDTLLTTMRALKMRKTLDYGLETERSLGVKGLFVDINGKFHRLKNLVWNSKEPAVLDEKLEDTYMDLAIYCLMSIIRLEDDKHETKGNTGHMDEKSS